MGLALCCSNPDNQAQNNSSIVNSPAVHTPNVADAIYANSIFSKISEDKVNDREGNSEPKVKTKQGRFGSWLLLVDEEIVRIQTIVKHLEVIKLGTSCLLIDA